VAKNNLIVLSDHYLTFIKDQVEILSAQFESITVFIPYNPLTELSCYIPVGNVKQFRKKNLVDPVGIPDNIHIQMIPLIYPPVRFQTSSFGDRYFHEVDARIKKMELPFDLIHAHFTWPAGYAGARLKETYRVPLVVTAHGYDIYDLPFRDNRWNRQITEVLNSADHIITVSGKNREYIHRLDVRTPVSVIPNGFNKNLFFPGNAVECRKNLGLPSDKKILLSVGNLVKEKGYSYLVESLADSVQDGIPFHCYLIGRGPLARTLEREVHRARLDEYITLAGGRPHNEIPAWINACDAFVLPSLMEGNPTVMFECLGCGRPFVGTRVGGIPEVIDSDDYGLLAEPKNTAQLSRAIRSALVKDWNPGAIAAYAEKFSWENICQQIYSIYQSVEYRDPGL